MRLAFSGGRSEKLLSTLQRAEQCPTTKNSPAQNIRRAETEKPYGTPWFNNLVPISLLGH